MLVKPVKDTMPLKSQNVGQLKDEDTQPLKAQFTSTEIRGHISTNKSQKV